MKQKIIEFLIDNADPSIVLRVKREVVGCLSKAEEAVLLEKIMLQQNVQTVIRAQKPDGWIGNNFHGQSAKHGAGMFDNMEVGLRYLAEKGLPPENEHIAKAVNSFLLKEPFDAAYGGSGDPPKPPDTDYTYTACGLYLARSSLIIRAGYEYLLPEDIFIDIKHDVDFSLKSFAGVLSCGSADDAVDRSRRKLCFLPGVLWPCLYHLRMLAFSQIWRSEQNTALLADSVNRLFSFRHTDDVVYTYVKGQYVGPCFAFIHSQWRNLGLDDEETLPLDIMELFSRCGILGRVQPLCDRYERMLSAVDDSLNINLPVNKNASRNWNPYFGFALEEDWRTKKKQKCDLLFRVLLIMHYTENCK